MVLDQSENNTLFIEIAKFGWNHIFNEKIPYKWVSRSCDISCRT